MNEVIVQGGSQVNAFQGGFGQNEGYRSDVSFPIVDDHHLPCSGDEVGRETVLMASEMPSQFWSNPGEGTKRHGP